MQVVRRGGIRWLLLPLATVVLAATVVACGGGGNGEGIATAGGEAGEKRADADSKAKDPHQAALEFARCMREHGVDMPDPEVDEKGRLLFRAEGKGRRGPDETPVDKGAHEACRHLLDGVAGPGDGKIDPAEQDRALKFARCMREHGVDMPDPDFSHGGISFQIGGDGLDPESPTLKAAEEACKEFFGPPGGGPSGEPVQSGSGS